ncbi:MAG: hypothetical protein DRJ42_02455 [Deltaproteobacteria bacterium]|nr:MAG: hypothetical protein DRJ42_02455 [Deltaproteobacteria bacterium]
MGTQGTLTQIYASRWNARRPRAPESTGMARQGAQAPAALLDLQCPQCEQSFAFGDTCWSCEVPLVDRGETFIVPKHADDTRVTGASSRLIFALVLSLLTPLFIASAGFYGAFVIASIIALGTAAHVYDDRHTARRRLAEIASRRANDERLEVAPIAVLPAESKAPVRVRGHLRFEVTDARVRAWVEADNAIAMLPISSNLRVANVAELAEVDAVSRDRIVEVVGAGRRVTVAGKTYREAEQVFAFDENSIVNVWL